jgi:hypothetical protein
LQFLQPSDLATAYSDAQINARRSWLKYDEFERLAWNEVRTDLPANMPRVNDGSLSASIRKVPKRLIAKTMAGTIKATDRDEDWVGKLADVILETRIIPNANTDAPFLNKWQTALKNAQIYGSQPIYTFFTQHGTYTGADMSLPYVRNVYLEPGKVSDMASDFIFMDSWFTKLQLKRLLDKAIADADAQDQGLLEDGDCIWDPKILAAIYDAGPSGKDSQNMNLQERTGLNRNEKGLYRLTTCLNRGYEAPFFTFSPNMANEIAGTQYNTNPTGDVPIIYLYADEDLINPYGTGMVQTSGATQNVLDNLTQTDVLSTQIGAQPPLDIHGDRSTTRLSSLQYSPRAFWFTGQANVTPVQHQNTAFYQGLPNRIALYKAQLQYQTGAFDNTIPAMEGATGTSKTPQGVIQNQNTMDADDSFVQQRLGEAYKRVITSMVNIHMNNMEGSELLKLEGDQIAYLATTDLVPTDQDGNPSISQIDVVWDNVRGTFDFDVDPFSSQLSNDQQQAQNLQTAISAISLPVSYYMAQSGYRFNIGEAYHSLFSKFRLENVDKIITPLTPEEKQAAQTAPFPIIDPPQVRVTDIPEEYIAGVMQNAGVQPGQPTAASVKDQAAMLTAQANATKVGVQAAGAGLNAGVISPNGQPGQPSQGPVQEGQQVAAQMAGPGAAQQMPQLPGQPGQPQPSQQDLQTRLIMIAQQYEVDPETAMLIAAAQDHGVTDEQLPQVLQWMAQQTQQRQPQPNGPAKGGY